MEVAQGIIRHERFGSRVAQKVQGRPDKVGIQGECLRPLPFLEAAGTVGVEGIAVGLSTKILSHNFIELIDASIKYLKNKRFTLYPDFITGGIADFTNYNDGKRGGKVRVRAKINIVDKSTLLISAKSIFKIFPILFPLE